MTKSHAQNQRRYSLRQRSVGNNNKHFKHSRRRLRAELLEDRRLLAVVEFISFPSVTRRGDAVVETYYADGSPQSAYYQVDFDAGLGPIGRSWPTRSRYGMAQTLGRELWNLHTIRLTWRQSRR